MSKPLSTSVLYPYYRRVGLRCCFASSNLLLTEREGRTGYKILARGCGSMDRAQ